MTSTTWSGCKEIEAPSGRHTSVFSAALPVLICDQVSRGTLTHSPCSLSTPVRTSSPRALLSAPFRGKAQKTRARMRGGTWAGTSAIPSAGGSPATTGLRTLGALGPVPSTRYQVRNLAGAPTPEAADPRCSELQNAGAYLAARLRSPGSQDEGSARVRKRHQRAATPMGTLG